MLKFTSVSGSVRATTDITLTDTIRTRTIDLIIDPITGRTTGTAATVITAIIIGIPIVTGISLTRIATPGWLDYSSQLIFFSGSLLRDPTAGHQALLSSRVCRRRRFGSRAFDRLIDLEFFP
jgi:hypothetical protein